MTYVERVIGDFNERFNGMHMKFLDDMAAYKNKYGYTKEEEFFFESYLRISMEMINLFMLYRYSQDQDTKMK